MPETSETITRTVESSAFEEISKATFKGFQLTFTTKRASGQLISLTVNGYKNNGNTQGESMSFNYSTLNGNTRPSITFTPSSSIDVELAAAIDAELTLLKAPVE